MLWSNNGFWHSIVLEPRVGYLRVVVVVVHATWLAIVVGALVHLEVAT